MARSRSRSRSASRSPSRRSSRHGSSSSRRDRSRDRYPASSSWSRRRSRSRSRSRDGRGSRRDDRSGGRESRPRDDEDAKAGAAGKPKTEEKNGEISMSVEETNRIRASLGLKPLSVGPSKKAAAEVNLQKTSAQLEEERERQELKRKLEQSRTRRELTQKLAGKSLGEQLRADLEAQKATKQSNTKTHDALEWVKQSRRKKATPTDAPKDAKNTEPGYDASALAGLTVGHAVDTFEDGQEVVLTLKDARVLGEGGRDLNEEEDELVNVELSEKDRLQAQQTRARRAAMPVYSGYDDDEFVQVGSNLRKMRKSAGPKLLAHYDEEQDAIDAERARKFRLDASGGTVAMEKEQQHEDEDDVAVVSLAMDRSKSVEDYYTKEEVAAQFAKRKKGSKKLRRKKKTRRHHDTDLGQNDAVEEVQLGGGDDGGQAGDSVSLVAQLEKEALEDANAAKDRGRRKRRAREEEDEDSEEEENLLRFQEAREKANAEASDALAASSGAKKRMKRRVVDDSEVADDAAALELELGASLARARQLTQQQTTQQSKQAAPMTSEDRIAALVSQTMEQAPVADAEGDVAMEDTGGQKTDEKAKATGNVFGQTFGATSTLNTVVFNEATDFETRLREAMEKRAAQFQPAVPAAATSTAPPKTAEVALESETKGAVEVEQMDVEEEKQEEEEESETWGEEQPLVSTGLGATLALLRKTGDLRQTRVERQAGRANDARERDLETELRIKDGVSLDYRDEFGRLLTKKEAFRLLSYKFHGHEPGKKKKEKRLKQLKEELEAQKQLSGEGSTKMMKVLEKKQKRTKQAHVVLSGGV